MRISGFARSSSAALEIDSSRSPVPPMAALADVAGDGGEQGKLGRVQIQIEQQAVFLDYY